MVTARHTFLLAASGALLSTLPPRLLAQPRFQNNPFTLGVASGYPQPNGIVLWTRLAPDALNSGGMPDALHCKTCPRVPGVNAYSQPGATGRIPPLQTY